MSAICARLSNKGKVGVQRGRETAGVPSSLSPPRTRQSPALRRAQLPAELQRKSLRPSGANTPAAVRVPRTIGAEKGVARIGRTACAVRVPQTAAACYPIRCSILSAVLCIACSALCAACCALLRIDGLSIAPAATIETTAPAIAPVAMPETKGEIRIKDLPPFIKFIESVCPLVPQILHSKKMLVWHNRLFTIAGSYYIIYLTIRL